MTISLQCMSQANETEVALNRVEPPFWWVGMKNTELQLVVYGKNISSTQVKIKHKGVKIRDIKKVDNKNYLFIDLEISPEAKTGKFPIDFTRKGTVSQTYEYELKQRKIDKNRHQGFNSSDVIYLIMPDRFANGNTENDTVAGMLEKADRNNPNGRHGGDLQGVIEHLDYIKDFGATTIWLNPVLENNISSFSYHGYSTTDFFKIDPRHGTNNDYLKLVDQAHSKGLKIVMDMVFNHASLSCWLIDDLPADDWLHKFEGVDFQRTNYRASTLTDPYASDYDKKIMTDGWFTEIMPDLNQRNPLLAKYLVQHSIWWIEYSGLDGIRMDTYPYCDRQMMKEWVKSVMTEYPTFSILGEAWVNLTSLTGYWAGNASNTDGFDSDLQSVTDFPLSLSLHKVFTEEEGWESGLQRIYHILLQDFMFKNPQSNCIFLDNHDLNRYYTACGENINNLKMAATFLLTTRGIPSIYYGTEILMTGEEHKGHGFIRKDFPGGWQSDSINAFTREGRTNEQNEAFDHIQKLLKWRAGKQIIHTGKLKQFVPADNKYVYFRYSDTEAVMVILNKSKQESTLDLSRFDECLKNYKSGKDIISGEKIALDKPLKMKPRTSMVIELSK